MIRKDDLLEEIRKCQVAPVTFASISRLSDLLIVYDHLFPEVPEEKHDTSGHSERMEYTHEEPEAELVVDADGSSEFIQRIHGRNASDMWSIMDELMGTLRVIHPSLYDGVMRRIDT